TDSLIEKKVHRLGDDAPLVGAFFDGGACGCVVGVHPQILVVFPLTGGDWRGKGSLVVGVLYPRAAGNRRLVEDTFEQEKRPIGPPAGAIVGVAEVLWYLLPSGRPPGAAPSNFVFPCHQLGPPAVMVSRVGRDDLGREIRAALKERGLADDFLQEDPAHP